MIQHGSPISGVDAAQDGHVLTAGYDNQLILWQAASHRALARACHDHLVNQCVFSPCGRFAASSSSDYSARLWRLPELRLETVMTGHEDDVEGIAFHPEKPILATCSRDAAVRLFDFSGKLLGTLRGHRADVLSVAWIEGGAELVSSSDDGTIKRWDALRGTLIEDIDLGDVETDTIALSSDNILFAGNDEGEIIIIYGHARRRIPAHGAGIKRLIFDARRSLLVSLSYDRTFKLWQWGEGGLECRHRADLPMIVWPRSVAFLDSSRLVFGTFGSSYAVYDLRGERWELDHIADTHGCNAVCTLDGTIYTVGDSGVVHRNGQPALRLPSLCNFLAPFAGTLLTGGQSGEVLDALTGRCCHRHRSPVNCATALVSKGAPKLLVGTYTGEGLVFGIDEDENPVFEREVVMHKNAIKSVAASAEAVFSVCADASAAFHCPDTFECRANVAAAHDKIANGCAVLRDGRFVSVSRDLKLRLWEGGRAKVVETPSRNSVKCVAAGTGGDLIAIGNYTGFVGIYSPADDRWLGWGRATAAGISGVSPSTDGEFLFSSYDGRIYRLNPHPWSLTVAVERRSRTELFTGARTNGHNDDTSTNGPAGGPSAFVPHGDGRWHTTS